MFDALIKDYIKDPDNPEHNWALALFYHEQGQTASALSYYLRAAERTDDKLFQYECMIRGAGCYDSQTTRSLTVRGMIQHAIVLCPERPEAYYIASVLHENNSHWEGHWFDAYTYASLGLDKAYKKHTTLRTNVAYHGINGLKLQKAHTAWWVGLADEATKLFEELFFDPDTEQPIKDVCLSNLKTVTGKDYELELFDWGLLKENEWFYNIVKHEVFDTDVYQKFFQVEEGDTVFDIGASVGPFSYKIRNSKASKIVAVEPHKKLYNTLLKNVEPIDIEVIPFNKAIGKADGKEYQRGLFSTTHKETQEADAEQLDTINFDTLLEKSDTSFIDFMKIDCEGGEYDIFTEERLPWIRNNVKKIVGEWHLSTPELKEKFRTFRDTYLTYFNKHKVFSFDEVDIKHSLWTDWFIDYYEHVTIYIENPHAIRNKQAKINKWKYSNFPTLEFTTIIPEKGCVVDCVFCPQRTLVNAYKGERRLTLNNFKKVIDKLPKEIRVTFAGFTEPWLNSDCTDMVLYAHEKGHPVSVFTTLVGVSVDDLKRIKHIPFAGGPNGGFTVHLPDKEGRAKHPINKKYLDTIEYLNTIKDEINNFTVMSMGTVSDEISHVFPEAPNYAMWSRAGNLIGERILKPELEDQNFLSINHGDKDMTCGCDERLYHNIMLPNGDVSLCCMDYGLVEITGNLFTQEYNDAIPNPYSTYDICKLCENAIEVDSEIIVKERIAYDI